MKVTAGFKPVRSEEPAKRSALLGCDLHACSMCQNACSLCQNEAWYMIKQAKSGLTFTQRRADLCQCRRATFRTRNWVP